MYFRQWGDGRSVQINGVVVLGIGQLGLGAVTGLVRCNAGGGGLIQRVDMAGHISQIGENILVAPAPCNGARNGSEKGVGKDEMGRITGIIIAGACFWHGKLHCPGLRDLGDGIAELLLGGGMVGVNGVQGGGPVGRNGQVDAEGLRKGICGFQDRPQNFLPARGGPAVLAWIEINVLGNHCDLHAAESGIVDAFYLMRHPVKVGSGIRKPASEHALCVMAGMLESL